MLALIVGLILFFGLHSVAIVAPYWRERMLLLVGAVSWKGGFGLLSGVGFILMCWVSRTRGRCRWCCMSRRAGCETSPSC